MSSFRSKTKLRTSDRVLLAGVGKKGSRTRQRKHFVKQRYRWGVIQKKRTVAR